MKSSFPSLLIFLLIGLPTISLASAQGQTRFGGNGVLAFRGLQQDPNCTCFNCHIGANHCTNFGICSEYDGQCTCPTGFGTEDCSQPLCGALSDGPNRSPRTTPECVCKDGWTGVNCNVCTEDSVCAPLVDRVDGGNATCYKKHRVVKNMFQKSDITNTGFKDLLPGKTITANSECNGETHACRFEFWVDNVESFACRLTNCSFIHATIDGNRVNDAVCANVQCECIPGRFLCTDDPLDLTELLRDGVKGPGVLKCQDPPYEDGRYNCQFEEPELKASIGQFLGKNKFIELNTTSGQCLHEFQVPPDEDPDISSPYTLIITIIGSALLVTLAAASIAYGLIAKFKRESLYAEVDPEFEVDDEMDKLMENGHHIPATVSFRNIRYEISKDGISSVVLRNVYGVVKPGEVMAIMGSSGAGKTTCLDILAGKSKRGQVSGELLVNGKIPTRQQFRRISGYVDQEDTLLGTLTVYETLQYSALLRLPKTMSNAAKEQRVRETMIELGIDHIANNVIGYPGHRGISGGEKRRVSIAMEVVTSPSILYLDEPTSGLDSYNALSVVQALVTLAKKYNRTIIMSIHQPRSNIFAMFDKLLLLAEGGYMIYSGPIVRCPPQPVGSDLNAHESQMPPGAAPEHLLKDWLVEMGLECPAGFNLADFIIDITKLSRPKNAQHNSSDSVVVTPKSPDMSLKPLSSSMYLRTWQEKPNHIAMNANDLQDLQNKKPHLFHLVTGFLKSNVCLETCIELNAQLSIAANPSAANPVALPSSPSISNIASPMFSSADNSGETTALVINNLATMSSRSLGDRMTSAFHSIFQYVRETDTRPSFFTQFKILSSRTFRNIYRNPFLMLGHYIIAIVIGLLCGLFFWGLQLDLAGFQNRLGLFFFVFQIFSFGSLTTLDIFAKERTLFVRERANGYYGPGPYFLSKVLFDMLPLRVIPPLMTGVIMYYMVGLTPAFGNFAIFELTLMLFNLTSAALCLMVAVSCGTNIGLANLICVMSLLFSMLFSGFLLNKDKISPFFGWLRYLSFYNYAFEAIIVNEVRDLKLDEPRFGIPIKVPGTVILATFGFYDQVWFDIASLFMLFLIFTTCAFMILQVFVKEKR